MAINYTDYATQTRQDFIKKEAKKVFVPAVEEYEEFHYEPESSDNKFLVIMLVGFVLLMSLYLVNTQAKAEDCNVMPISPMSLADYWGKE
jgi:hypothetical protein